MNPVFGIDFGSAYSRGAFWNAHGHPEVLRDATHLDSTALLPSALRSQPHGKTVVGWPARRKRNAEEASLKRRWLSGDVDAAAAMERIFSEVRALTSELMKVPAPRAAFSLPFSVEEAQQRQFEKMVRTAGFEILGCLPETAAAALAYSYLKNKNGVACLYNLGSGFFEFAVFETQAQKVRLLGVESLALGGEDLDLGVAQNLLKEMGPLWNEAALRNPEFYPRLLEEAEKTRCALSHRGSCDLEIQEASVPQKFSRAFSRFELAKWVHEKVEKTIGVCERAMKKAGVQHADIQEVFLSGGVTRMPCVQETVEKIFRKKGNMEINPDLAVVYGALIYASMQSGGITGWSLEVSR